MAIEELQETDAKLRFISRGDDLRFAYLAEMKAHHDAINIRNGFTREGFKRGLERGLAQGIEQGRQQSLARMVVRILETRFGPLDPLLQARIGDIQDVEVLETLADKALTVGSVAALELG